MAFVMTGTGVSPPAQDSTTNLHSAGFAFISAISTSAKDRFWSPLQADKAQWFGWSRIPILEPFGHSQQSQARGATLSQFHFAALEEQFAPGKQHNTHTVQPRHRVCSIFTLDNGFLVGFMPVLKLGCELEWDHFQVAWVMVPGEIAVHTNHIHVGSLQKTR